MPKAEKIGQKIRHRISKNAIRAGRVTGNEDSGKGELTRNVWE